MVAGCQATAKAGKYAVYLVLLDGSEITDTCELLAPKSTTEADSLSGLRSRVFDFLRDRGVDQLALWRYEAAPGGASINAARPVIRAEGAILAAAGELGIEVVEVAPSSERKKEGVKNDELVALRVAMLTGSWKNEARRAAAAATFV
jgi:hypothetical protein